MDNSQIYYSQQPILHSNKQGNVVTGKTVTPILKNRIPFTQILAQELNGIQFSQHALERLQARNIHLGQAELAKINTAVDKAAQKGAKESLLLMDNNNLALVVSVKNKTVITAMDSASMKNNVFTNIDSAIIL